MTTTYLEDVTTLIEDVLANGSFLSTCEMVGETLTLDRFLSNLNAPVTFDEVQDVAYELSDFIKNDPRSTVDTPIPNDPTFKVFTLNDHPHTYELREERNGSFAAYVSPPAEDYPTYARVFSNDQVCHLQYGGIGPGGTAVTSNRYEGVVSIVQRAQGSTEVRVSLRTVGSPG